jgi:light-regulated signal transduction histidine kinase (bacteriophytochrome)
MPQPEQSTELNFSACEKEPIHLIDKVQPHGALLVLDEPELRVVQASANAASILQCDVNVIGELAESLLSESSLAQIRQILDAHHNTDLSPGIACLVSPRASQVRLRGLVHRLDKVCILELEPDTIPEVEQLAALRQWIAIDFTQLVSAASLPVLLQRTAIEIQKICGFDRVMIYQFDQEWHGTVIAEHKRDFMESFLKHSFPASDIPAQARALYTKNLIRLLVDVDAVPASIVPAINPLTATSLDLTYSILRSMSQVHIEYLKNMGVAASMSISLLVQGKLWGLIACHHKTAKFVDFTTRSICELVCKVASSLIERYQEQEITIGQLELARERQKIFVRLTESDDIVQSLRQQIGEMISVTNAKGAALVGDGILELHGSTPDEEMVQRLFSWLHETVREPIFFTDRLSLEYPQWTEIASQASGLMAVNITSDKPLWLLWFRPELIEDVLWAGNPHKSVEMQANQTILHPRKYFESWAERVRGKSSAWKSFECESASSMQSRIFSLLLSEHVRQAKTKEILRQQREDVLALLTHDLKVPVVAMERVCNYLIVDKTGKVPQDLIETLLIMQSANQKLRTRIQKVLEVLRYELDIMGLNSTQIDFAALVNESLAEIFLLPDLHAEVITTISQNDQTFKSDQASIKRLVVNLVDNAMRAAGASGTVHVVFDASAAALRFTVTDNGSGIAHDVQAHMFDRFWQGGGSQRYSAHVGMGLYLCKRIIESLKGTISLESTPGKGTRVDVYIPSS